MREPLNGPADLTPLQRQYLNNMWEYCHSPPTLGRMYAKAAKGYVVLFSLLGLMIYLCLSGDRIEVLLLVCGMSLGILSRDLGMFLRTLQVWPAIEAITDRQRLAALIDKPERGSEPDNWS